MTVLAFGSRGEAVKQNLTNIFLFRKRFTIIPFSLPFRKNEISRRKSSSFIVPPLAPQSEVSVIPDPNAPIRRKVSRFEVITFSDVSVTKFSGIGTRQSVEPETITPNLSSDSLIVTVESDDKVQVINEISQKSINSIKYLIFIHFIFHRVACLSNKVSVCPRKKKKNGRQMKCSRWPSLRKI